MLIGETDIFDKWNSIIQRDLIFPLDAILHALLQHIHLTLMGYYF